MSFMKDFDYLKIQMEDIVTATSNFDSTKVIGVGGFGKVYKGELSFPEGQITAAFKKLDRRLGQGSIEFWKEVMMLSRYKHENLITLLHFGIEGDEMILVYEYASRGSLDRYLSDASTLSWIQRLRICVGVARGVHFLHDPKETQQRVLHRDIKSANILLDEKWTAKLSDFGLSRVGPANQSHTYLLSHGVGTPGYCDPLYMELGFLSKESDVYSFGVVLFEILCGRLCCEYHNHKLTKVLVPMWRQCYDENRLDDIILPALKEQMDPGSLKLFSAVAYQCVNKIREERPMMAEIVKELELSLKRQEIFENTPKSSDRERTSLTLNGQMDQSPDNDHRLKFKLRKEAHVYDYILVNKIFHDRADDDYSQSPLITKDLEGWILRKTPSPRFNNRVAAVEEASSRQNHGIRGQRQLWEHYDRDKCPDEEFKEVLQMTKATFNKNCEELHPAFEHTKRSLVTPVRPRVAVYLYRLATSDPSQTVSTFIGTGNFTCNKVIFQVSDAIKGFLVPKFPQWTDNQRLEQIKTKFESISRIPNISRSIHTTHVSIISQKNNVLDYVNKKHTKRNQKPSYLTTIQGVVDSCGVFTDMCIGLDGSITTDILKSYRSRIINAGELKDISIVGGSSYPLLDWLSVSYTHQNQTSSEHSYNKKINDVQKIAKDGFMRSKGRWAYLEKGAEKKLQDMPVVLGSVIKVNPSTCLGPLFRYSTAFSLRFKRPTVKLSTTFFRPSSDKIQVRNHLSMFETFNSNLKQAWNQPKSCLEF